MVLNVKIHIFQNAVLCLRYNQNCIMGWSYRGDAIELLSSKKIRCHYFACILRYLLCWFFPLRSNICTKMLLSSFMEIGVKWKFIVAGVFWMRKRSLLCPVVKSSICLHSPLIKWKILCSCVNVEKLESNISKMVLCIWQSLI